MDVPDNLNPSLIRSARTVVGNGYVDSYYAFIASRFHWLYQAGVDAERKAARALARKRKRVSK